MGIYNYNITKIKNVDGVNFFDKNWNLLYVWNIDNRIFYLIK